MWVSTCTCMHTHILVCPYIFKHTYMHTTHTHKRGTQDPPQRDGTIPSVWAAHSQSQVMYWCHGCQQDRMYSCGQAIVCSHDSKCIIKSDLYEAEHILFNVQIQVHLCVDSSHIFPLHYCIISLKQSTDSKDTVLKLFLGEVLSTFTLNLDIDNVYSQVECR